MIQILIAQALFLLQVAAEPLASLKCDALITMLVLEYQTNPGAVLNQTLPFILLSGRGSRDYGFYDGCLRDRHSYTSVTVKAPNNMYVLYGFCHASECSTQDIADHDQEIKQLLNQTGLPQQLGIDILNAEISYVDPQTHFPEVGFNVVATIIVLSILLFLNLCIPIKEFLKLYCESKPETTEYEELSEKKNASGILDDFNLINNAADLTNFYERDRKLGIFNGFRSLSFLMVVFGHQYLLSMNFAYPEQFIRVIKSWQLLWVVDMFFSVDFFFWIGGFFLGFALCDVKKLQKLNKSPLTFLVVIAHRFLRIWPCFAIAFMINSNVAPFLGSGPRFYFGQFGLECQFFPWRQLLFIDNLFHVEQNCLSWGWYLTTDFQIFLLCLIPVFVYAKGRDKLAFYTIFGLLILCLIIGAIISFHNEYLLPMYASQVPGYNFNYYKMPFARAPPYLVGLILGISYRELSSKHNPKSSSIKHIAAGVRNFRVPFQVGCYIIGFGILGCIFLGWRPVQVSDDKLIWPKWYQECYHSFSRFLVAVGLSFVTLPSLFGISDYFNSFLLDNLIFKFIAKISFSGYLIHFIILQVVNSTFYQTPQFDNATMNQTFVGCLAIILVCSVLFYLLFEVPLGKVSNRMIANLEGRNQTKQDEVKINGEVTRSKEVIIQ